MDSTKRQITKIARESNKLVVRTMKEEGLDPAEQASFTAALDKLYLRSKQESRNGFTHIAERLSKKKEGTEDELE